MASLAEIRAAYPALAALVEATPPEPSAPSAEDRPLDIGRRPRWRRLRRRLRRVA